MNVKLKEPIVNGSLRATNFFNGRLVTGADLTREQTARREAVWRVGRAAGDGIVSGLEVSKAAGDNPLVKITKGLAVNRCGQTLYLADDTTVDLLQRFGSTDAASTIFGDCNPISSGTYAAGFGYYLLVLSPVQSNEGLAPTSGLNNALASCNTDVILETVQFNLYPVDPFFSNETLPAGNKLLRNYLAYRCFGYLGAAASTLPNFFKDPHGFSLASYGLMDEMRSQTLSDSEVPLAIIRWASGLEFVEMWAVRRRVTGRDDVKDWTQLVKDRRAAETEAMMMHFAAEIDRLKAGAGPASIAATEHFQYLPPAGMLPLTSATQAGFNGATFFGSKYSTPAKITGDRLRVLLRQALSHEPINLTGGDGIQFYVVTENEASSAQKSLVFARNSLPYLGVTIPKVFNFAPNFLPMKAFLEQYPKFSIKSLGKKMLVSNPRNWDVSFNSAVIPGKGGGGGDKTASISGTVIDPKGSVIPSAKIVLKDEDGKQANAAVTNDEGKYSFKEVKPGGYTVEAEIVGVGKKATDKFEVKEGENVTKHIFGGRGEGEAITIHGAILDPLNATVPGAFLSLANKDTGSTQTTTSNANGFYIFNKVQAGSNEITVTAAGFAEKTVSVEVDNGDDISLDIHLEVEGGETGGTVLGAFVVELPDEARIVEMSVRGRRLGKDAGDPKLFVVSLIAVPFDKPETGGAVVTFDLRLEQKEFKQTKNPSNLRVKNGANLYAVMGHWQDDDDSARFQINSIKFTCEP